MAYNTQVKEGREADDAYRKRAWVPGEAAEGRTPAHQLPVPHGHAGEALRPRSDRTRGVVEINSAWDEEGFQTADKNWQEHDYGSSVDGAATAADSEWDGNTRTWSANNPPTRRRMGL